MRSVSTEQLLRYCRLDPDDPLAETAREVAEAKEEYLTRHGVSLTERNAGRYGLCVMAWTLHEIDHPGEAAPQGVIEMVNNLRFTAIGGKNYGTT